MKTVNTPTSGGFICNPKQVEAELARLNAELDKARLIIAALKKNRHQHLCSL